MERSAQCIQCGRVQDKYTTIPTAELEALRAKADKWKRELDLVAKTVYPHEKDRFAYSVLEMCEYVASLRAKAEAGERDTAHDFKPGDVFVGKVVQVKIHSMLFGETGLLSIHSVVASVKGTHAGVWSKEQRAFTLEQWHKFIGAAVKESNAE